MGREERGREVYGEQGRREWEVGFLRWKYVGETGNKLRSIVLYFAIEKRKKLGGTNTVKKKNQDPENAFWEGLFYSPQACCLKVYDIN